MPVFTSSIEVTADYPTIKPSLNLNFARSRSLDPRITFTRASVGTYIGRDGLVKTAGEDEARFDHDPETLESLGLLIEESRTNSIAYSDGIGGGWGGNGVSLTTINSVNGPDGIAGVTEIRDNTGSSYHAAYYGTVPVDGSSSYTVSAWLKKGPNYRSDVGIDGRFQLYCSRGTGIPASIQITFGFDTLVGQTNVTSSSITQYPNGWIRVTYTFTSNAAANVTPHFLLGNGGEYQGDATNSVYIWGAQLELGSFPTSLIPTSGATVTRAADLARVLNIEEQNFYNFNEGTYLVEGIINATLPANTYGGIFGIGSGGGNSNFLNYNPTNNHGYYASNTGQSPASSLTKTYTPGTKYKLSGSYDSTGFSASADGDISSNTTTGVLNNTNNGLFIGSNAITTFTYGVQTIAKASYYPQRLTDAQLQLLTS